jgi:preprotein translocase subunit SecG
VILFLTVVHVMVCLILIVSVLLQRGKGAEIGAVFGGGGSSTVFGSRGAGTFLSRLTTGAAAVFFMTSLTLAILGSGHRGSVFGESPPPTEAPAPAGGAFEEVAPPTAPVPEPNAAAAPEAVAPPAAATAPAQPAPEQKPAAAEKPSGGNAKKKKAN